MKALFYMSFFFCTQLSLAKDVNHIENMIDSHGQIYSVSSQLDSSLEKYGPHNLFDDDNSTAWVEGVKGPGINESIKLIIQGNLKKFEVINGYAKSSKTFSNNNRIKEIKITAYKIVMPRDGMVSERYTPITFKQEIASFSTTLRDTKTPQSITPTPSWIRKLNHENKYGVEIEILSIYKGAKFDDTCLTQLKTVINSAPIRKKITVKNDDSEVWVDDQRVLKSDEVIYQLIEVDNSGQWAIFILMANTGIGRMETSYMLFSIEKEIPINPSAFDTEISGPYGLKTKSGVLYLEAYSTRSQKIILIDLKEVK